MRSKTVIQQVKGNNTEASCRRTNFEGTNILRHEKVVIQGPSFLVFRGSMPSLFSFQDVLEVTVNIPSYPDGLKI